MKKIVTLLAFLTITLTVSAQEDKKDEKKEEKKQLPLKIGGYVQGQWQWAEQKGVPAFQDGGQFPTNANNRFMVRRAMLRFAYKSDIVEAAIAPGYSEKSVGVRELFVKVGTRNGAVAGQVGLFDHPFGYETSISSALLEAPERSRVCNSILPGEADVGAQVILKGPNGVLADFSLKAGLFNGNGIGLETDSKKDFIGQLVYLTGMEKMKIGGSFSYYNGGVLNPTTQEFVFGDGGFMPETVSENSYALRQYFGFGAQWEYKWIAGHTRIKSEFIWGNQPGTYYTNAMPAGTSLGMGTEPLYLRKFNGFYLTLAHSILKSGHNVAFMYDFYDPNTDIKGDQIGASANTGPSDVRYHAFGLGYYYQLGEHFRFMAYYDFVRNEKSANLDLGSSLSDFSKRIKQDVFTLRVQARF